MQRKNTQQQTSQLPSLQPCWDTPTVAEPLASCTRFLLIWKEGHLPASDTSWSDGVGTQWLPDSSVGKTVGEWVQRSLMPWASMPELFLLTPYGLWSWGETGFPALSHTEPPALGKFDFLPRNWRTEVNWREVSLEEDTCLWEVQGSQGRQMDHEGGAGSAGLLT